MNSKILGFSKDIIKYYKDKANKKDEQYFIMLYVMSVDNNVYGLKAKELFISFTSPYFELFEYALEQRSKGDGSYIDDLLGCNIDVTYNESGYLSSIKFDEDSADWIQDYIKNTVVEDVDSFFDFLVKKHSSSQSIDKDK